MNKEMESRNYAHRFIRGPSHKSLKVSNDFKLKKKLFILRPLDEEALFTSRPISLKTSPSKKFNKSSTRTSSNKKGWENILSEPKLKRNRPNTTDNRSLKIRNPIGCKFFNKVIVSQHAQNVRNIVFKSTRISTAGVTLK